MSVIIQGSQLREIAFGVTVRRAAALLPQTATGNLFVVSGGRILVTGLIGNVAVAMPATVNTVKLSGPGGDFCTATSTASAAVGTQLVAPASSGSALVVSAGPVNLPAEGIVTGAGNITVTTTGSAATGTVDWTLLYIPLDDGASAAAA